MLIVDTYLDCLHEGKIWDKTKEYAKKAGNFVKKHKGKFAAGAGIAAAVAGGVAAKKGYNKYSNSPEKVADRKAKAKQKKIAYYKAQKEYLKRNRPKQPGILKSVAYAVGKTAQNAVVGAGKVGLKAGVGGAKLVGRGAGYVGKSTSNAVKQKVKNKVADYKFERMRKKRQQEKTA